MPAAFEHAGDVVAALAGHEAEVEPADPGGGGVQDVEAVPVVADQRRSARRARGRGEDRGAIRAGERAGAEDQHRPLGLLEALAELVVAAGELGEALRAGAELDHRVGQVRDRADPADREAALAPALAQPGVDQRGLEARVGADQQADVGLLDAGDGGVEEVAAARLGRELRAVLAAVEVGRFRAPPSGP